MSENSPTFRLFKKMPTFLNGFASSMDFFSDNEKIYKVDKTEKEADWNSIHADWLAVGNDINKAITEEYEAERK